MPGVVKGGARHWSMTRDEEGHRNYQLKGIVHVDPGEGPATALQAAGLPQPGTIWLVDNDIDVWAFCRQPATVAPASGYQDGDPIEWFEVTVNFSTKPDSKRCKDQQIEDPLLVPDRVSGGFVKYTEEARFDRSGIPIVNSAHEMIRGPQVEFDAHRTTFKIEQNVPLLQLDLLSAMANTVNAFPIWGCPTRCVKFMPGSWSREFYGTCEVYYKRELEFEVWIIKDTVPGSPTFGQQISGFDRNIVDEGCKVLYGHWSPTSPIGIWLRDGFGTNPRNPDDFNVINPALPLNPDPNNPRHFIRYKDRRGENTTVILNGRGEPSGALTPARYQKWIPQKWYSKGDVVINLGTIANPGDGSLYIATTKQPNFNVQPPAAGFWVSMGPAPTGQAGMIHVEKYDQSDFTALKVPLTF